MFQIILACCVLPAGRCWLDRVRLSVHGLSLTSALLPNICWREKIICLNKEHILLWFGAEKRAIRIPQLDTLLRDRANIVTDKKKCCTLRWEHRPWNSLNLSDWNEAPYILCIFVSKAAFMHNFRLLSAIIKSFSNKKNCIATLKVPRDCWVLNNCWNFLKKLNLSCWS